MLPSIETKEAPRPDYVIRTKAAAWQALRNRTGLTSDRQLGEALGINAANVYRVLAGQADPSPKFIAHALTAFPFASFDRLFTVATR